VSRVSRFALVSLLACNAITGAKERTLDPDLGVVPDRDSGDGDEEDSGGNVILEAGPQPDVGPTDSGDAGPIVFVLDTKSAAKWSTPNGATWTSSAAGVKINGYDGSANNHPIIVPFPQPSLPSEDYTIRAVVVAPPAGGGIPEFGLLARIQPSGAAVVFGNVYGANPPAFLGDMAPTWDPANKAQGPAYTYAPNARYHFWMHVAGTLVTAKLWAEPDPEPTNPQISYASPYGTGKAIAYYTYLVHTAVLESMTVTVP